MAKFSFILCDSRKSFGNLDDFARVLRQLKSLGFQGVELNITPAEVADADELLRLLDEVQLPVASFLTGANYFGEGLCLSSPDATIRHKAVERLSRFTSVAARFGAVLVVGQMQGFRSDEPDGAVAEERIEAALRQVAVAAEENGTTVVIEPVNHLQCGFHNTLDAVLRLTERIGSPRIQPMLDSFHMNIEETSMTEPIRRASERLAHFHLCESNGRFLGSGQLDIPALLKSLDAIDYRGFVSVKVYREPWELAARETMRYLKDKGLATA